MCNAFIIPLYEALFDKKKRVKIRVLTLKKRVLNLSISKAKPFTKLIPTNIICIMAKRYIIERFFTLFRSEPLNISIINKISINIKSSSLLLIKENMVTLKKRIIEAKGSIII